MEFIQLSNDVNGNPKVAVHFFEIPITELELKEIKKDIDFFEKRYQIALSKAKKIGGKEYRKKNNDYFVFTKNIDNNQLREKILSL
jgi:hypothetical protein